MIQISRKGFSKTVDGPYTAYAVPHRRSYHQIDLLLACFHEVRWVKRKNMSVGKTIYVVRDDQDWELFKIANGIIGGEPVEIVDDDLERWEW